MTTLQDLPQFSKAHRSFRTYRDCPGDTIDKYRETLPAVIIRSWEASGFQEIGDGFLWTVDPDEFRDIVAEFIYPDQKQKVHVFLRSAFGCLIMLYEGNIVHFSTVTMRSAPLAGSLEATLEMELGQTRFLNSIFFRDIFRKALPRLGKPTEGEVYGFEPALPLGGEMEADNLQRVNLVTHLHFLSQFARGGA